ncbi:MAG: hypothetical protein ACC656_15235, partial [Candidatus Heimdallarchaeota archaeon]
DEHANTYFYDLTNSSQVETINSVVAKDIQTALELRFLPSNLYSPIVAYNEIQLEMVLIDFQKADQFNSQFSYPIPNVNHDFFTSINPDHIVNQLSSLNPYINWTYSLTEYDWRNDEQMRTVILNNIYPSSATQGTIDANGIMNFLDIYYQKVFSESTKEKIIIPMFLFGMPGQYLTDFGGIANGNDVGQFNYIITARNVYSAQGLEYKYQLQVSSGTLDSISNPSDFFGYYSSLYQNELTETSLSITGSTSANVTLEILDYFNVNLWYQGLPYKQLYSITNLKGGDNLPAFNISATDAYDAFFWVLSNDQVDSADYSITVNRYRTISSGMTNTALHEVSHAV